MSQDKMGWLVLACLLVALAVMSLGLLVTSASPAAFGNMARSAQDPLAPVMVANIIGLCCMASLAWRQR